jgi:hypothetical protein
MKEVPISLPNFSQSILQLGSNEHERARQLGVSARTVQNWRYGKNLPPFALALLRHPELAFALWQDTQCVAPSIPYPDESLDKGHPQ